ncbi:MAG: hypothetical protein ACK53W_12480 [Gemmatimonadota bacterium]|jgi:hypothetical protein
MTAPSRRQLRTLRRENAAWPTTLIEVPPAAWPAVHSPGLVRVWRSREYLVQLYAIDGRPPRLSINRTDFNPSGRNVDGIAWDDLQRLKAEAGFGSMWAVEVYPADGQVINVANMRHLWLLPEPPPFAWRARGDADRPVRP